MPNTTAGNKKGKVKSASAARRQQQAYVERNQVSTPPRASKSTRKFQPTTKYLQWIKRFPLRPIEAEEENDAALEILSEMIDLGNNNQLTMAERAYMQVLSSLIDTFEEKAYKFDYVPPRELLRFLMDENGLRQIDLVAELGSQGFVSDYLAGKRNLSRSQIEKLSKRFHLSPSAFHEAT